MFILALPKTSLTVKSKHSNFWYLFAAICLAGTSVLFVFFAIQSPPTTYNSSGSNIFPIQTVNDKASNQDCRRASNILLSCFSNCDDALSPTASTSCSCNCFSVPDGCVLQPGPATTVFTSFSSCCRNSQQCGPHLRGIGRVFNNGTYNSAVFEPTGTINAGTTSDTSAGSEPPSTPPVLTETPIPTANITSPSITLSSEPEPTTYSGLNGTVENPNLPPPASPAVTPTNASLRISSGIIHILLLLLL